MEEDELKIQHQLKGRPESPALETTARKAIESAFAELITKKLLYQKVATDLSQLPVALTKAGAAADIEKLKSLEQEISLRPWELETRHLGDRPEHLSIFAMAKTGGQPVGTPVNELQIHFYAPSVHLQCSRCKAERTFIALVASNQRGLEHPFPRRAKQGTEQVFTIFYRCEGCREVIYSVLVRREGLRIHLCGFAPRRAQSAPRAIPKLLEPILIDAINAVAEGDLFGGFYHVRTMLEHYLKNHLGIPIDSQVRGEDLLAQYYDKIPQNLRSTLPAITPTYAALSQHLHSRSGTAEDFNSYLCTICDHITAVDLLTKYNDPNRQ